MGPELSIIVPVYNSEKYLDRCINSILAQTFTDFEVILVDDGSIDQSGKICDKYAQKDCRIIVIHQDNRGVSAARNVGLKIAKGRYITFVDSDDYIEEEMYQKMITILENDSVDLVICGFQYIDNNNRIVKNNMSLEKGKQKLEKRELLLHTVGLRNRMYFGVLWNKVFKRSVVNGEKFEEKISFFEDWLFLLSCYIKCNSAIIISQSFYHYTATTENSLGKTIDGRKIYGSLCALYDTIPIYKNQFEEVYANLSIRFLEDCLLHGSKIHKKNKMIILRIKLLMIKQMIKTRKYLTSTHWHKYIYEGIIKM